MKWLKKLEKVIASGFEKKRYDGQGAEISATPCFKLLKVIETDGGLTDIFVIVDT